MFWPDLLDQRPVPCISVRHQSKALVLIGVSSFRTMHCSSGRPWPVILISVLNFAAYRGTNGGLESMNILRLWGSRVSRRVIPMNYLAGCGNVWVWLEPWRMILL